MKNPFEYGGVVSGNAFCNREKEVADLLRAMENNEKLFVLSERRYGKTSLVRTALGKLPKKDCVCAYVDLWPTAWARHGFERATGGESAIGEGHH